MEGSGRVAPRNSLRKPNCTTGGNGGTTTTGRSGNANSDRQVSGTGYEGSSEGTNRQNIINVSHNRRRSRSWKRHTQQQLDRVGQRKRLPPVYRKKRWRHQLMQKQTCLASTTTTNVPLTNAVNISTNGNCNTNDKLPDQQRQQNSAPISSTGSVDAKPAQQLQHSRRTAKSFNEMKSGGIIKTCINNDDIKLTFQVQLAHGSPTGIISGFSNIIQLYQAIANCYDEISMDDILFCTVNTHRISMDALLCSTINVNDFIFAHIAGQKKEVTLVKTEPTLGLTIADNGAGKAFIKRIVPGTLTSKAKPALAVGDFIEKINGECMVGRKHFDVARCLRALPIGLTFTMRLIEPQKTGFNFISSYAAPKRALSILDANKTIRFKADGTVIVQELPNAPIINKMNDIFDSYFGFHDNDLAQTIWEMISVCKNFIDFKSVLQKSDINNFDFPTELYFDLWGMVDDYRNGRLDKVEMPVEEGVANDDQSLPDEEKF
ncbi:unnamed protein product [Litomosoides sigmodontis]|uniref:PDZ domain-containing protein n=1 Tax=Litomosoides sigmodontis TaxID=42156 RepID=A0A3P6TU31_LITSI|nr:unnamed protein product [Litomosoides sigmodontis]